MSEESEVVIAATCLPKFEEHMRVPPCFRTPAKVPLAACECTNLVLMLARKFGQNKFLSQAADNMQAHVHPKSFEYLPRGTL